MTWRETDAGPAGFDPERARRPGLRQPAAGLPQAGHPDDVRDGPAAADVRAADLDRDRPGRGRAAVGLRGGERVPRQGLRGGACASFSLVLTNSVFGRHVLVGYSVRAWIRELSMGNGPLELVHSHCQFHNLFSIFITGFYGFCFIIKIVCSVGFDRFLELVQFYCQI